MSALLPDNVLDPDSLVVLGASARADSPGHFLARNIMESGFRGTVFLVNPRYGKVLDQRCYRSVRDLPEVPALAIILVPPRRLIKAVRSCALAGIRVAIIMSGTQDRQALSATANEMGIRLFGPYSAGFIRPGIGLNATLSENRISSGNLALISQAASLALATIDWAETNRVGFSALLSTGSQSDISVADCLDLLAEDRMTRAVIVYLDNIKQPRRLLSALAALARIKPVVLMCAAHVSARYCDALTRSGATVTNDDVFQAALQRVGVVRIRTFANLFAAAKILSTGIRIKGSRVAILSNAEAPAEMALDKLQSKHFDVPVLDPGLFPLADSKVGMELTGSNPLLLRSALQLRSGAYNRPYFESVLEQLLNLKDIDALLVIYVPNSRTDPLDIARSVINARHFGKPLITCWMGDTRVVRAREVFAEHSIPTFRTPEAASDALDFLLRYHNSQQQLLQLPHPATRKIPADICRAKTLIRARLAEHNRVPGPLVTRQLLKLFDIQVLPAGRATTLPQALKIAADIGYPVAMKLVSPNVNYKSTIVPTQLEVSDDEQLSRTWELIRHRLQQRRPEAEFRGVLIEQMLQADNRRYLSLSISRDPTLGPFISVSIGGDMAGISRERTVDIPPLNSYLIKQLLRHSTLELYLGAHRHAPALDSAPVHNVLRRLSEIACQLPEVFSLDINPLIVCEQGAFALDAQVVLQASRNSKRYGHLAIHPYPWEWVRQISSKTGERLQLRPIQPGDATGLVRLVQNMSAESRYFRFMHAVNELTPLMIARLTKLDYDRQMAFVATPAALQVHTSGVSEEQTPLLGVAHYTMNRDRRSAEFAVSVGDQYKHKGIASALMKLLIEHARTQGLNRLSGDVLRNNTAMIGLMNSLGFSARQGSDDPEVVVYAYELTDI